MLWLWLIVAPIPDAPTAQAFASVQTEVFNDVRYIALDSGTEGCRKEIEQLDAQIQKLAKERDAHGKKAAEYQHKGDNWQYESHDILDAYQDWAKADEERKKMLEIQNQIDALRASKEWILQFYPQLRTPSGCN